MEKNKQPKFSDHTFFGKLNKYGQSIGQKSVYIGLLLYYAFKRKETPTWAKNIIIGALTYLISPIDFIPDLSPLLGYTDDITVMSFGLVTIACYINEEVKTNAKEQLSKWFTRYDPKIVTKVDESLKV